MTPTELWDIYYHAAKKWLPKYTDDEIRNFVKKLMEVTMLEVKKVAYERKNPII